MASVILHLAESLRAGLDGLRQRVIAVGLRDVGARKPGESSRRRGLHRADLLGGAGARVSRFALVMPAPSRCARFVGRPRPQVEMQIEDRRAPFVRLLAPRGHGRQRDGRGNGTEKTATGQHAQAFRAESGLVVSGREHAA